MHVMKWVKRAVREQEERCLIPDPGDPDVRKPSKEALPPEFV